jgi:hypothetical protein
MGPNRGSVRSLLMEALGCECDLGDDRRVFLSLELSRSEGTWHRSSRTTT